MSSVQVTYGPCPFYKEVQAGDFVCGGVFRQAGVPSPKRGAKTTSRGRSIYLEPKARLKASWVVVFPAGNASGNKMTTRPFDTKTEVNIASL